MSFEFDIGAAKALPSLIKFGTSTWTYPGWKGLVYHREYKSERSFKGDSLGEYASHPWFRTVGVDSSFYTPLSKATLQRYADQVPSDFRWVSKVWERLTIPRYPTHKRYGRVAGQPNPDFLNAELMLQEVLEPIAASGTASHIGPFVFQFPTINREVMTGEDFFERLDTFLSLMPAGFRFAVELRNPELLTPEYFSLLNRRLATHCFNHWHYMPPLKEQMKRAAAAGGLSADFYVARILTPLGVSYEDAVKLFEPYETIRRPNPTMRDDVVRLALRALERGSEAFVIVNNRSEGNAPMTIDAIGKTVVERHIEQAR